MSSNFTKDLTDNGTKENTYSVRAIKIGKTLMHHYLYLKKD